MKMHANPLVKPNLQDRGPSAGAPHASSGMSRMFRKNLPEGQPAKPGRFPGNQTAEHDMSKRMRQEPDGPATFGPRWCPSEEGPGERRPTCEPLEVLWGGLQYTAP